jgi:hypothetical protein
VQEGQHSPKIDKLHPNEVRLLLSSLKAGVEQASCVLGPHGSEKLARSLILLHIALGEFLEARLKKLEQKPALKAESEIAVTLSAVVRYGCKFHDTYLSCLHAEDSHSFPVELLHPIKFFLTRFGGYLKNEISFGLLDWDKYNFQLARHWNPAISVI